MKQKKEPIEFVTVKRKLSDLIPYPDNPRTLTAERKKVLKDSLLKFGLVSIPAINKDGTVLAGNQRLEVLGEIYRHDHEIDCRMSTRQLSKKEADEYNLRDNVNVGEWDESLMLSQFDTDYLKSIGFEEFELSDIGFEMDGFDTGSFKLNDSKTINEEVKITKLKPHPKRYREHTDEQLKELAQSLEMFGFFRSVITSSDYTILDGHGIVEAAKRGGIKYIPVMRMPVQPDSDTAIKILISNNEMGKFSVMDDRKLTELLKELKESSGLDGTGFDEMMLANLLMVTRHASEVDKNDPMSEWVGMPDFNPIKDDIKLVVSFPSNDKRVEFCEKKGIEIVKREAKTWSTKYPYEDADDLKNVKFE